MSRIEIEPTVVEEKSVGGCDTQQRLDHPAFGVATLTTIHGGDKVLFGSDIGHDQRICISISGADVTRNLSNDWIHGKKKLIEVEMSHAQFARFITSNGNGDGTPVTLKWTREGGTLPGIKKIETKNETFRREIGDVAKKAMERATASVNKLGAAIATGKVGIVELRKLHASLQHVVSSVPGSMQFVVGQAEEALEKATSDAKIEVESYIAMTAQRIGLKQISDLALIGNDAPVKCAHAYSKSMDQTYPRQCVRCGETESAERVT